MERAKVFFALAVAAAWVACGPCGKKPAPPTATPLEEILTESVSGWDAGQWCKYRLTSAGGRKAEVSVSLTGKEKRLGTDYFWLEVVVEKEGRRVITKALVPQLERVSFLTSAKDLTKESERLIIKVGDERAMELPLREIQLLQQFSDLTGKGADLNKLFGGGADVSSRDEGTAEYTTLSGKKLTCRKMALSKAGEATGTVYAADEVPIFGIAYSEHEQGKLDLIDFGSSGATTNITEEPEKIDFGGIAKDLKGFKIK